MPPAPPRRSEPRAMLRARWHRVTMPGSSRFRRCTADERQGPRGQGRRRGEVALHHGAREGGASRGVAAAASAASGLRQHASPLRRAPLRHLSHARSAANSCQAPLAARRAVTASRRVADAHAPASLACPRFSWRLLATADGSRREGEHLARPAQGGREAAHRRAGEEDLRPNRQRCIGQALHHGRNHSTA